jgi:hypothetical protein
VQGTLTINVGENATTTISGTVDPSGKVFSGTVQNVDEGATPFTLYLADNLTQFSGHITPQEEDNSPAEWNDFCGTKPGGAIPSPCYK